MKRKIEVEFEEVDSAIQYGFRMEWASGKSGDKELELTSGAGCGSPYMVFTKIEKGKTRHLVLDVRKLIPVLDKALS